MPDYFVGLDLGQLQDYTAVAVIRRDRILAADGEPVRSATKYEPYTFTCGYLERHPLGTSYPAIVKAVKALLERPGMGPDPTLVVDATGVGTAVVDMLEDARLPGSMEAISITSGRAVTRVPGGWNVAKVELIGSAQASLSQGRLKVARGLAHAETLKKELADYRVKVTAAAHEVFEARTGAHDDLVLAVSMCCWLGGYVYYSCGAW
jgi:hypothetical protein